MSADVALDAIDRRLLQALQDDFPLDSRPWQVLGRRLGLPPDEVLERARRLARQRVILSIGPVVDARSVGLAAGTLVALRVPVPRLAGVARMIATHPAISHCYERDHAFNLWFTLAMPDRYELERELGRLLSRVRVPEADRLELPARRRFKVDVRHRLLPCGDGA